MTQTATITEIPYTVRRSSRARRVRVNVHAHTGVEVVLPARAPERAAAAAVSELRPWIERRLSDAQEVLERIAERAGTVPYLGARWSWSPSRVARACTVAASACWFPPAMPARRWSASTAGPRARRSRRAWTAPRRSRAAATGT